VAFVASRTPSYAKTRVSLVSCVRNIRDQSAADSSAGPCLSRGTCAPSIVVMPGKYNT